MTTIVDTTAHACACLGGSDSITWYGVTNGAISLSPTGTGSIGTWTKVATIPFTTGQTPLAAGLFGFVWLSWSAKSASVGKFSVAQRRFFTSIKGASSIGSYVLSGAFTGPSGAVMLPPVASDGGFCLDAPEQIDHFVQVNPVINGSGDLDIYLNCLATDYNSNSGVAWDFTGFSAEYAIVGCS